jgi:hypothetical protein
VAFLAPEDAFLAGLTYAAFRQRRALRVAPAFEGPSPSTTPSGRGLPG